MRQEMTDSMKSVVALVEYNEDTIRSTSRSVIDFAGLLQEKINAHVTCILYGTAPQPVIDYLTDQSFDVVNLNAQVILNDCEKANIHEVYREFLESQHPTYVLAPHNDFGLNLIPYLAGAMTRTKTQTNNGSVVTGIDNWAELAGASILVRKPSFFGRIISEIEADLPVYLTIAPSQAPEKAMAPHLPKGEASHVPIHRRRNDFVCEEATTALPKDSRRYARIDTAKIVIGIGRGIGSQENLEIMKAWIDQIPGAVMAGSRPLIDAGWMPYPYQVGITGKQIEPDIYIALGISGSSQHLAGIANAKMVIAVNTDKYAPIFKHADYCIHADLFVFMEAFIACFNSKQK